MQSAAAVAAWGPEPRSRLASMPLWPRRLALLGFAAGLILGALFVALVPAGLPYDEPSHWDNVLYWMHHLAAPRIGSSGVSYEAQMGPVAYAIDALFAWPLHFVSLKAAFYAVRSIGLIELGAFALVTSHVLRTVILKKPGVAYYIALLIFLNPMLLAMSASVQNDTLALLLAVVALEMTLRERPVPASLAAGAALLTKITVWPVIVGIAAWFLWQQRWRATIIFSTGAALVAGWWFVRNLALYGDLTGRGALRQEGFYFPPWRHAGPVPLLRDAITYLWLPTEYVRNMVRSPPVADLTVGLLSVVGAIGVVFLLASLRSLPMPATLLAGIGLLAVAGWIIVVLTTQGVAFRFAYVALPAWFLGIALLATRVRHAGWVLVPFVFASIGLSVWFLAAVSVLPGPLAFAIQL